MADDRGAIDLDLIASRRNPTNEHVARWCRFYEEDPSGYGAAVHWHHPDATSPFDDGGCNRNGEECLGALPDLRTDENAVRWLLPKLSPFMVDVDVDGYAHAWTQRHGNVLHGSGSFGEALFTLAQAITAAEELT